MTGLTQKMVFRETAKIGHMTAPILASLAKCKTSTASKYLSNLVATGKMTRENRRVKVGKLEKDLFFYELVKGAVAAEPPKRSKISVREEIINQLRDYGALTIEDLGKKTRKSHSAICTNLQSMEKDHIVKLSRQGKKVVAELRSNIIESRPNIMRQLDAVVSDACRIVRGLKPYEKDANGLIDIGHVECSAKVLLNLI